MDDIKIADIKRIEELQGEELKSRLSSLFAVAKKARLKYEWRWYLDKQFVRGEHYLRHNTATNRIEIPPNVRNKPRVAINKTYAILRAVRRFVTEYRPKFEVAPEGLFDKFKEIENIPQEQRDPKTITYDEVAKKHAQFLDYMAKEIKRGDGGNGVDRIIKEFVYDGLITSVGFVELYYDERLKDIVINTVDPFSLYVLDPHLPFYKNRIIWKVVPVYISDIKNNPVYKNTDDLKADNVVSASEIERMLVQSRYGVSQETGKTQDNDVSTVLLYEAHIRQGDKIRIVSYTDTSKMPLRDELIDDDEFQFGIYSADISPREVYGEGWVKNLRPLNMVLNNLESTALDYVNKTLKSKILLPRVGNSLPRTTTTENAEIVEYTPSGNSPIQQLRLEPLPQAYYEKPQQYAGYMEDVGGAHNQFMGRGGEAGESGRHVEAVRAGDAQNLADLRENLEETLIWMGKRILKLADRHYAYKQLIEINNGKSKERFFVVGQSAMKRGKREMTEQDALIIGPNNRVKVVVGSWLAQTLDARREFLLDLFDRQAIDRETLLTNLDFGNIDDVLGKVHKEIQSGDVRGGQQQQGMQGAQGVQPQDESVQMAQKETDYMIQSGKPAQPTPAQFVTKQHIQVHVQAANDQKLPPKVQGMIMAHAEEDEKTLQGQRQ